MARYGAGKASDRVVAIDSRDDADKSRSTRGAKNSALHNTQVETIDLEGGGSGIQRPISRNKRTRASKTPFCWRRFNVRNDARKTSHDLQRADCASMPETEPIITPLSAHASQSAVDKSSVAPRVLSFDSENEVVYVDLVNAASRLGTSVGSGAPVVPPAESHKTKGSRTVGGFEYEIKFEVLTAPQYTQPSLIDCSQSKGSELKTAVNLEEHPEIEPLTQPQESQEETREMPRRAKKRVKRLSAIALDSDVEIAPKVNRPVSQSEPSISRLSNRAKSRTLNEFCKDIRTNRSTEDRELRSNPLNGDHSRASGLHRRKRPNSALEEVVEIEPVTTQRRNDGKEAFAAQNASHADSDFSVERRPARRRVLASPSRLCGRSDLGSDLPSGKRFRHLSQLRISDMFYRGDNDKEEVTKQGNSALAEKSQHAPDLCSDSSDHDASQSRFVRKSPIGETPRERRLQQRSQRHVSDDTTSPRLVRRRKLRDVVTSSDDEPLLRRKRRAVVPDDAINDDKTRRTNKPSTRNKRLRKLTLGNQEISADEDSEPPVARKRHGNARIRKRRQRTRTKRKERSRHEDDGFIVNTSDDLSEASTPAESNVPDGGSSDAGSVGDISESSAEMSEPTGALWEARRAKVQRVMDGKHVPFPGAIMCAICEWFRRPPLGTMKNGWRDGYIQPRTNFSAAVQKGNYGVRMALPFCLGHTVGNQNEYVRNLERKIGDFRQRRQRRRTDERNIFRLQPVRKPPAREEHSDGWREHDEESSSSDGGFIVPDEEIVEK